MKTETQTRSLNWESLFAAWLIAVIATLGALFVGEVLGQAPCVLCWYQRIAMFPLVVLLGVASFRADAGVWRYGLPLAAAGCLIAGYHTLIYYDFIAEAIRPCNASAPCGGVGMTILGGLPLPVLSFVAFSAITILLLFVRQAKTA